MIRIRSYQHQNPRCRGGSFQQRKMNSDEQDSNCDLNEAYDAHRSSLKKVTLLHVFNETNTSTGTSTIILSSNPSSATRTNLAVQKMPSIVVQQKLTH